MLPDHESRGTPEGEDGRRTDMWVATSAGRRLTFFRPGKLFCQRGHHVREHAMHFGGHGARYCDKRTPHYGSHGERSHEGPCNTWLYVIAGLHTYDATEPLQMGIAVEVTHGELRHISDKMLSLPATIEYLGLSAWTRR